MSDKELVTEKPVEEMTKNELAEFAMAKFGVELDLTQKKDELLKLVKDKMGDSSGEDEDKGDKPDPVKSAAGKKGKAKKDDVISYLKHPKNGRVYVLTEHLVARGDMLACDKDGTLL